LLVEVAETLFPLYGLSSDAVRLVVTLLAVAFPLVLVFSWVYELTPEGIRREKDLDQPIEFKRQTATRLDRAIIILLALALGYFSVDKFIIEPRKIADLKQKAALSEMRDPPQRQETAQPDKSIAVLPFRNLSTSPQDEYFSDGLTEELIGSLAKISGLLVTARTSAFAFKDVERDVREIGERLNVKTVLEGSVRRENDRVRVSVQLIGTGDGFNLWSESYDYELESVLALQEAIAKAIVSALQIQLSPQVEQRLTLNADVSPEAYDLYLKGRYFWARLDRGGFEKSIESFRQAIVIDPGYAPAHAGLATAYSFAGYFGIIQPGVAYPLSIEEAEKALSLDPNSVEALIARGMAWLVYDWDWERAREYLDLALELGPNDSMAHWAYSVYLGVVDPAAALESAKKALELDPLSLPLMNLVAFKYFDLGMYSEAVQTDQEMLAMNPNFPAAHWNMGIIHIVQGRYADALPELVLAVEYSGGLPPTLAVQAYALAKSGDQAGARSILADLVKLRESPQQGYAPPLLIAYVHEGLGDSEEALDWLDIAIQERDGWLVSLNSYPRFDSLRSEPRFQKILKRLALPDAPRSTPHQL
jgi:adenylate cyclase